MFSHLAHIHQEGKIKHLFGFSPNRRRGRQQHCVCIQYIWLRQLFILFFKISNDCERQKAGACSKPIAVSQTTEVLEVIENALNWVCTSAAQKKKKNTIKSYRGLCCFLPLYIGVICAMHASLVFIALDFELSVRPIPNHLPDETSSLFSKKKLFGG